MKTTLTVAIRDVLQLDHYEPGEQVDRVMTNLVSSVISEPDFEVAALSEEKIQSLRSISAKTESELELFWTRIITAAHDPTEALGSFPYKQNYDDLVAKEVELLLDTDFKAGPSHQALVIGSGPLPLSAITLHKQTGMIVDQVDSSEVAVRQGEALSSALDLPSTYFLGEGQQVRLSKMYDVILIAALAGQTDREKRAIIDHVIPFLSKNGRIIIRSARGARSLLYPVVSIESHEEISPLREYHPSDHIINSILIYGRHDEN